MTFWLFSGTALACALMGGIFFAFSSFVMPALGRIPAEDHVRTVASIVAAGAFVLARFTP